MLYYIYYIFCSTPFVNFCKSAWQLTVHHFFLLKSVTSSLQIRERGCVKTCRHGSTTWWRSTTCPRFKLTDSWWTEKPCAWWPSTCFARGSLWVEKPSTKTFNSDFQKQCIPIEKQGSKNKDPPTQKCCTWPKKKAAHKTSTSKNEKLSTQPPPPVSVPPAGCFKSSLSCDRSSFNSI